jgi:hypothetical protein
MLHAWGEFVSFVGCAGVLVNVCVLIGVMRA